MYNGVNDENNESGFNSDENLYHYSYSCLLYTSDAADD